MTRYDRNIWFVWDDATREIIRRHRVERRRIGVRGVPAERRRGVVVTACSTIAEQIIGGLAGIAIGLVIVVAVIRRAES